MKEIFWDKEITEGSFPFKVSSFKVVQTHISYVFITDAIVYKIKKPVNFGFLDFTTLEKRKFFCEKEVDLNKRLCPDLYIGVVPIVKIGNEFFFEKGGEIVEYAVKMKKLPEDGMMQELLKKNEIERAHIDLINERLVPFYKKARADKEVAKYGKIEVVSYNTEENFSQTKDFVGIAISQEKYDFIVSYTRNFIKENQEFFEKRIKKGFIKEGHGDLYSANICFDDLKKVYIFDCIEFNERFRCGDVASEIAFLSMDLDYHGLFDLSNYFVETYVEKAQDFELKKLLNFYKCYRAYVRGKIGCFTWAGLRDEKEKEKMLESARKYFDLAYFYAGGIPKLVVFLGLSGTGKTFLAQNLLKNFPAVYIASDVVRKKILALDPSKHYYAEFEKGIYSPEITERTYKKMCELAKKELLSGRDVILDATFRDRKYRELLRKELKNVRCEIYWVWCFAEDEVIRKRMEKRKTEETYSDALWDVYLSQKKKFEEPEECGPLLKLDTSADLEVLLQKILKFLKN